MRHPSDRLLLAQGSAERTHLLTVDRVLLALDGADVVDAGV
ncbi:hypothetical protein [Microbacterium sp. XT11]|nr:hypothetical protein [Microbacterium sp. XT11]